MLRSDEEIARENDAIEYEATRAALLRLLPDAVLLDRFAQSVANRAIRAAVDAKC